MEYPYFDLYSKDGSRISFERWTDTRSVGLHRHEFYELIFVAHGSCRHMYRNAETLLIPGDAVIVTAHQAHGFSIGGETIIINSQFHLDCLDQDVIQILKGGESLLDEPQFSDKVLEGLTVDRKSLFRDREDHYKEGSISQSDYSVNSNKQGVIHLSPAEFSFVKIMLENGLEAQNKRREVRYLVQKKCLEIILLDLKEAQSRQNQKYIIHSKANQKVIATVLVYIEEHLDEALDFNYIAKKCSFSPNYFRKIFKDVTGFSTVHYVNRLRMIRACEYIQKEKIPIREAAERVGIYDLNYFSRLFKKVMGCAPSKV